MCIKLWQGKKLGSRQSCGREESTSVAVVTVYSAGGAEALHNRGNGEKVKFGHR